MRSKSEFIQVILRDNHNLVGTMSDSKLGKQLGVSCTAVHVYRHKHGIPKFGTSPLCEDYERIDRVRLKELYEEGLTDTQIAGKLGRTVSGIRSARQRMGLLRSRRPELQAKLIPLQDAEHYSESLALDMVRVFAERFGWDEDVTLRELLSR